MKNRMLRPLMDFLQELWVVGGSPRNNETITIQVPPSWFGVLQREIAADGRHIHRHSSSDAPYSLVLDSDMGVINFVSTRHEKLGWCDHFQVDQDDLERKRLEKNANRLFDFK